MSADGESTEKSKGRKDRWDEADIDELIDKDGRLDLNELKNIPTVVPREGDGYQLPRSGSVAQGLGRIGEPGRFLTEDDLRRVNTRKGLIQLLENKAVNIEEVRKTLLYEQELRQLQVELVKLQRWVQGNGERIAILVEGRDAAGKGGTIRRFTEHLNPRAMGWSRCPNRRMKNAASGTSNAISASCPTRARSCSSTAAGTTA